MAAVREGARERQGEGKTYQAKKFSPRPRKMQVASPRLTTSGPEFGWWELAVKQVGEKKCSWEPEEHWVLSSERGAQDDHVICARRLDLSPHGAYDAQEMGQAFFYIF